MLEKACTVKHAYKLGNVLHGIEKGTYKAFETSHLVSVPHFFQYAGAAMIGIISFLPLQSGIWLGHRHTIDVILFSGSFYKLIF